MHWEPSHPEERLITLRLRLRFHNGSGLTLKQEQQQQLQRERNGALLLAGTTTLKKYLTPPRLLERRYFNN
jgi:hypothetical protein